MAIYFTSDLHGFHSNIIKYCKRPFLTERDKEILSKDPGAKISQESVEIMNDTLIANINATVGEDDSLWHLGDFCFAPKYCYYQTCKGFRDRIKCKNVYNIWGNHDHRVIADLFNATYDMYELYVENLTIVLCHYPLFVWNKSHHGSYNLFGHCHSTIDNQIPEHSLQVDVGVDSHNFKPWSLEEVRGHMMKKTPAFLSKNLTKKDKNGAWTN